MSVSGAGCAKERRFMVSTRRRFFTVLLALAVVASVVSVGASGGAAPAVSATLTSTGSGSVPYTPDGATLTFSASTSKPTAVGAIDANATAMNAVIDAIKRAGATDVSTEGLSLSARYNKDGTAVVGFQAGNSVQGKVAIAKVGSVIDAAVASGATGISGPTFSTSSDLESLYRTALRQAITQARERAQVLADAAGVRLVRIVSINPASNYAVATATPVATSSGTPVLPPTQNVTASATLVFAVA